MIALIAFCSVAVACGLLSLVVVARRWAFIGEGIGHSGFGGAGTAWMLMCLVPALDRPWLTTVCVVLFSLAAALGMGWLSRRSQLTGDVAIGIFLVATVAWGFLGQRFYLVHRGTEPAGFVALLFGQPHVITTAYMWAALSSMTAVLLTLGLLRKEIIAYCVDPMLAEISGVRAGFVHYLLITLIGVVTVVGMQVVGTLLITALLVLPGATAGLLSRRLGIVTTLALSVALAGAIGGHAINQQWHAVPLGPAFVLVMFALFLAAFVASRVRRT